ncbi:2-hydroxymuconate tautomerase [Streptococcus pyogenes]
MPFVTIDLFEGRSQEQKNQLAREVTEVVSRIAKAPKENIHVFINQRLKFSQPLKTVCTFSQHYVTMMPNNIKE